MSILLFIFSGFLWNNDSNHVHITVVVEGQSANTITIERPFNNDFYLAGYQSDNTLQQTGGNKFEFSVPFSGFSFFEININSEYYLPIALSAGDSVFLKAVRTANSGNYSYKFTIKGSNSEAHRIYLKRFYPPGWNFDVLDDLSKTTATYSQYFHQAKNYIDSLTKVWDSLKSKKLVSEEVYKLYASDTKAILYEHAIKRLAKIKAADSSLRSYMEWNNVKQLMLFFSGAGDPILRKTAFGIMLDNLYLRYIMDLDDSITDSLLRRSELRYFYYYDTSYREWAWGNTLYDLKREFPVEGQPEREDFLIFKKYYPNSIYVKKIESYKDSMINERKKVSVPAIIDSSVKNNLSEIFSTINSRFVFVDVWATWCIPCVQEFKYQSRLTDFLNSNSITEVFLSIDQQHDTNKWTEFIRSNGIGGHHFLIGDKAQKELLKILTGNSESGSLFIPRFLMYDQHSKKYYLDLPRPRTGVVLENQIKEIIQQAIAQNK